MTSQDFETNKTHPNASWRPWELSTGPLTAKGKLIASKNSLKHGYYKWIFREFRKNRRRPGTIQFEGMCLCLIKAVDTSNYDDMGRILIKMRDAFMKIWEFVEHNKLNGSLILENTYIITLYETIIRYSFGVVIESLNKQIKENDEK